MILRSNLQNTYMKRTILILLCTYLSFTVQAQKSQKGAEIYMDISATIDGVLDEWEGKLISIDADSSWSYAVSYDGTHLYVGIAVKDITLQQEAVRNGFLFNINTEGKTKEGAHLYFPIPDRESVREMLKDSRGEEQDMRLALLDKVRGYYVKGFDGVLDGLLSLNNSYGVQAIAEIDEGNILNYEAKIPMSILSIKTHPYKIAVQVGVNTRWHQYQQYQKANRRAAQSNNVWGRAMAGSTGRGLKNPYSYNTEVWLFGEIK